ncbi:hypothetical protein PG991_014395 [Apiospora marii]|uniref:DUF676 domain-containing protein n=1 Tax=Apiospora marii TaxID=335849 RepID=A0ABR1R8Y8_9PEZI
MADIKRKGTVRRPNAGGSKPKKDISIVKQGIKQLYPETDAFVPEIDIVFVPGLGAHPEECWETKDFKWPTDSLAKDFPKSRILLYMYESVWQGALQVEQFMDNIAMGLLVGVAASREKKHERRPIVFIGHSMGGLVIAKAVTMADSYRKKFPILFEAIAATIFFGTPFRGAAAASAASMYASAAEKLSQATSSELLDFMKPGNPQLRELVDEFTHMVGKVSPAIAVTCFYEERNTDLTSLAKLPSVFGNIPLPAKFAKFVTRESATLEVSFKIGLAANHRDLVKFASAQESHFLLVRHEIKDRVNAAPSMVKNRMNAVRDIDQDMINKIDDALEGPFMAGKRKALAETFSPSSWITKEPEYIAWLAESNSNNTSAAEDHESTIKPGDCLWVRGPEGRGKTSASMAVINDYEQSVAPGNQGQDPVLLAYFFCDQSQYFCTAEDVLKSIIRQLIKQQKTLAPYAKSFIKKAKGDKAQAQITIENLWQVLQDMLTDTFIGSKVIFVLNNLHVLPENSASTTKLMNFLKTELSDMTEMGSRRVATRWFITSREAHNVGQALGVDGVRLVDLEDEKYGNQVQIALKRIAKSKVESLVLEKRYNKALAYFVSSLIGKRAQNTQWIEISCVQLYELGPAESDLKVRRVLETMPQDLRALLNNAWRQVFGANAEESDTIKEMLRALVLTYDDPTEQELGVLAGLCSTEEEKEELHHLIEMCKPLIFTSHDGTVSFMNVVVKSHLLENAKDLLGMSPEEVKWQHGVLALRCFDHVNEAFDVDIDLQTDPEQDEGGDDGEDGSEHSNGGESDNKSQHSGGDDDDGSNDGTEDTDSDASSEEEYDPEVDKVKDLAMPYTVKHWLRHASKATYEIAEDLSIEDDFWSPDSRIRRRWLIEYHRLTNSLEDEFDTADVKNWTALHIVSAVGFQDLVAALIRNGHEGEISQRDGLNNIPLHLAACFGRTKIAQELLNKGAPIDDGIEINEQTPLHMAAFGGHVDVMKILILRGANPNATSNDIGPVVNAAISSGNRDAVKLLVAEGVSLTVDPDRNLDPPLALAALLSDLSMFEYLVEQYADRLPTEEYSKALVKSAEAGRVDVFNKLLNEFQHEHQYFQEALDAAVGEWNWDVAKILLDKQPGLDCNNLFHKAATVTENQDDLLGVAWVYSNGAISQETVDRALYDATDCEKKSTVELLLGEPYKGSPNAKGEDYGNALTAAAYDGTADIVRLLLEAGADIHDPAGWPLQTAAAQGHKDLVLEFLERGADVNACTENPSFEAGTALQGACEAGRLDIVELLFQYGADPDLGGGDEGPPIIAATKHAEAEIMRLLVEKGAELNIRGGWDESTPLTNAAGCMYKAEMEVLLHAGADINLTDGDGDTALTVACGADDDETVRVLLEHGADMLHANGNGQTALQIALEKDATDCLEILVERTAGLFAALRAAVEGGIWRWRAWLGVPGVGASDTERRRPGMIEQVSEELKSALGTQISLYQQFSPGHFQSQDDNKATTPPSATQPPRFSSQAGPGWQQWPGSPGLQASPPLPSSNGNQGGQQSVDVPAGLSIPSPPIRRKPAPVTRPSYDGLIPSASSNPNTPSPPPSLAPGRPPKQYVQQQQQQQSPPSSSQPFMAYNPSASPPPPSSASYFPSQQTPPPVAPKPAEYTTQAQSGGGGYYSHNNPGTGSGNNGYPGRHGSPAQQPQQQQQQPAYYPVGQNPYGGWDGAQQQHQQQQQQQRPPQRASMLDRARIMSNEFLRR